MFTEPRVKPAISWFILCLLYELSAQYLFFLVHKPENNLRKVNIPKMVKTENCKTDFPFSKVYMTKSSIPPAVFSALQMDIILMKWT